jgi:nitrogen fixation protein NifX
VCAAVYCNAVGASAIKQLLAAGIQPVRLDDEAPIEPLLKQVSAAIRDGGIPWVDKALRKDGGAQRFERMAAEGWDEE